MTGTTFKTKSTRVILTAAALAGSYIGLEACSTSKPQPQTQTTEQKSTPQNKPEQAVEQVKALTVQDKINILQAFKLVKEGKADSFDAAYEKATGKKFDILDSWNADTTMEGEGLIKCSSNSSGSLSCGITDKGLALLKGFCPQPNAPAKHHAGKPAQHKPSQKELKEAHDNGVKEGKEDVLAKLQEAQGKAQPGSLSAPQNNNQQPNTLPAYNYNQYGQGAPQQNQVPMQQPMYAQQPVMVGGYGALGYGAAIPYCPWYPWQSPYVGYPYNVCWGYVGGIRPYFLWHRNGRGWGRESYGGREFGQFFGSNKSGSGSSTSSKSTNNTSGQGSSSSRTTGAQGQWNHFNGFNSRQPNTQNQNRPNNLLRGQNPYQRNYNVPRQGNQYNNMLRGPQQQFNQQRLQQQYRAPAPQYHAPSAPHYGGNVSHSGGNGGRRR